MQWLAWLAPSASVLFSLVLARVAGILVTAPIYGGVEVPAQVRVLLALVVSLTVLPLQGNAALVPPETPLDWLVLLAIESMIGVALGLGILIVLSGMQLAGQIVSQLGGMSLAEVFNPQLDASLPLFSQYLHYFSLALFALMGGHRIAMAGLLDSFATLPPGGAIGGASLLELAITLMSQSFLLGLRVAAPAMVALLLATIVLGLASRTLPQLNVLSFGFGLSALVMLTIVAASLPGMASTFESHLAEALDTMRGASSE